MSGMDERGGWQGQRTGDQQGRVEVSDTRGGSGEQGRKEGRDTRCLRGCGPRPERAQHALERNWAAEDGEGEVQGSDAGGAAHLPMSERRLPCQGSRRSHSCHSTWRARYARYTQPSKLRVLDTAKCSTRIKQVRALTMAKRSPRTHHKLVCCSRGTQGPLRARGHQQQIRALC